MKSYLVILLTFQFVLITKVNLKIAGLLAAGSAATELLSGTLCPLHLVSVGAFEC